MCDSQRKMRVLVLTVITLGIVGFVYVDAVPLRKSLREAQKAQNPQDFNQQQQPQQQQQQQYQQQQLQQQAQNLNAGGQLPGQDIQAGRNLFIPAKNPPQDAQLGIIPAQNLQQAAAPQNPAQNSFQQQAEVPQGGMGGQAGGLGPANPDPANVQVMGGVQQLGGQPGAAQVQRPASDGAKPDNVVVAQQAVAPEEMPAGGAPNANVKPEVRAPPPPPGGDQQVPQPQPADSGIKLAKVPRHREQQIEQPEVENQDNKHPIKKAMFLDNHQPLKVKDLQPPDHLDAVRLEQDGHLNRDYKKEIFLGNHEEVEQGTEQEIKAKLKDIFQKIDSNSDGFISTTELEEWIIKKVEEHFAEAVQENEHVFKALDTDTDGDITWREFHIQFLMARGHDQKKAEKHMEDYETIPLEPDDKEQLIRFKFRWAEADEDPQDNKLTLLEFRNFRHPEQSENMLMRMVMDIIENLDKDHDGIITEEEFAALPPGEVDEQWKESDRMWQDERKKEFKEIMDLNHDGKVTKEELKRYVDPKNPQHSKLESQNLIELADSNKDSKLSLEEMLENTELFLGSKVVNTGRSFHDEF